MSKLWDFLANRAKKNAPAKPQRPFLHEAVKLQEYPVGEYLQWHTEGGHHQLQEDIAEAYRNYLIRQTNDNPKVDIMLGPTSNGYIVHCNKYTATAVEYKHFMYMCHNRLIEHGYRVNLADVKTRDKGNYQETVYRHYLKPSLRHMMTDSGKANQLYGNITLELVSRNGNLHVLKLLANSYTDQNYEAAAEFSDLIKLITTGTV